MKHFPMLQASVQQVTEHLDGMGTRPSCTQNSLLSLEYWELSFEPHLIML